jgi:hypothetical protein
VLALANRVGSPFGGHWILLAVCELSPVLDPTRSSMFRRRAALELIGTGGPWRTAPCPAGLILDGSGI